MLRTLNSSCGQDHIDHATYYIQGKTFELRAVSLMYIRQLLADSQKLHTRRVLTLKLIQKFSPTISCVIKDATPPRRNLTVRAQRWER